MKYNISIETFIKSEKNEMHEACSMCDVNEKILEDFFF
jgi:hypothetical protein